MNGYNKTSLKESKVAEQIKHKHGHFLQTNWYFSRFSFNLKIWKQGIFFNIHRPTKNNLQWRTKFPRGNNSKYTELWFLHSNVI